MSRAAMLLASALWPAVVMTAQEPELVLGGSAEWSQNEEVATTLIEIAEGSALRREPFRDAELVMVLAAGSMPLLESRGSWVKVRGDSFEGWVDLEAEPDRKALRAASEPDERSSAFEVELSFRFEIGPYVLFSEHDERARRDDLAALAREHLRLYLSRYALVDTNPELVSGDILLFSEKQGFDRFTDQHVPSAAISMAHRNAFFQAPERIVILRGRRSRRELYTTLVHELTHLLNWRFMVRVNPGRASIPVWLDEGMAEDLALASLLKGTQLRAGRLDSRNLRYGPRLGLLLNEIELRVRRGDSPPLASLVEMDREEFSGDERNTIVCALWIRFLLDENAGFRGLFQRYLRSLEIEPDEGELALWEILGSSSAELEVLFGAWLRVQGMNLLGH